MSVPEFKLCTFRLKGLQAVGLGVGATPSRVVDVQQLFAFLNQDKRNGNFLVWPGELQMLHILDNWDCFESLLAEAARMINDGDISEEELEDFTHEVNAIKFAPPVPNPKKVLSAGGNYYDHMEEMGVVGRDTISVEEHLPYIFVTTPDNTLIGNGDEIRLPQRKHWRALDEIGDDVTWETELAVVIGKNAKDVSPTEALEYVAGYTIYQDISAEAIRTFGAFEMDWFNSKSADTYSPMGPWLVPSRFIPDPQNLRIKTTAGGVVRQDSSTNQMMYSCAEMVSYASSIVHLQPGDIIATGTCSGNGFAKNIDRLDAEEIKANIPEGLHFGSMMLLANREAGNHECLEEGQVLISEVEGLGQLVNPVVQDRS